MACRGHSTNPGSSPHLKVLQHARKGPFSKPDRIHGFQESGLGILWEVSFFQSTLLVPASVV
jgi:hypothetical protein